MSITFKMHRPNADFGAWAEAFGREAKKTLEKIAVEVAQEAAVKMIDILEKAATDTGRARVARGGNGPGRVDSGQMRDAIKSRLLESSKNRAVVGWGWLDEVVSYYLFQEYGDEAYGVNFEGMSALQGSFVWAREEFHRRLKAIGREV